MLLREKYSTAITLTGWILVVIGIFYLFLTLSSSNSPYSAMTTDYAIGVNLEDFWLNFIFVALPLIGGLALLNKLNKIRILIATAFIFIIILAACLVGTYNNLVYLNQSIQSQVSNIIVIYQLRLDTVPDLLLVAREPLAQEQEIQGAFAEARNSFAEAKEANQIIESANQIEQVLGKIISLTESYPSLRTTQEFQNTQLKISETGDRLASERIMYNETALYYNSVITGFPTKLFAEKFNFQTYDYWGDLAAVSSPILPSK